MEQSLYYAGGINRNRNDADGRIGGYQRIIWDDGDVQLLLAIASSIKYRIEQGVIKISIASRSRIRE